MSAHTISRRDALGAAARTLAAGIAGAVVTQIARPAAHAADLDGSPSMLQGARDAWLRKLDVGHKMLFDSPDPNGGVGLAHMLDYYDTYNGTYAVRDADIRGVFTFYGMTTAYSLQDAMWAKYRLGELAKAEDPATGRAAVVNPWRRGLTFRGQSMPRGSIEALQQRGAIFIVCNSALVNHANRLAQQSGGDGAAIYEEFKANVLPGIEIVPSMVVAIEQAHRAGVAYQRK